MAKRTLTDAMQSDNNHHPDSIRNDVDSATLSRVIMNRRKDADLTLLLGSIATACKLVSRSIRKAGIAGLFGVAGSSNATGDDQKKLDVRMIAYVAVWRCGGCCCCCRPATLLCFCLPVFIFAPLFRYSPNQTLTPSP